ncbi:MAG: FAD:protein FMN transferase, partial [Spirochaetales bacterium]|nr:FAD:protein FMN transferase [Spirochaetales bacterium]
GMSSGGFDPSVGPLVKLWGVGTENARIPRPEEIETALALTDYRRVQTDPENRGVLLADRGMALDLGGIAKGYAADEAAKILVNHGVTGATVNLGGNVLTLGEKPDGSPWKIGIQDPASGRGDYVAILQVKDLSVVTSGPYERFFIGPDGKRYHHILSGETGYPVESVIISVTILARDSMTADALSTAVFVLGLGKGMELIESLEGIEGMFITQEQAVYASSGLLNQEIPFSLSDTNYTLVR